MNHADFCWTYSKDMVNHTDPWPRLQALPASRRGECLAPKRATQVWGKNIENATLLHQDCITFIAYCTKTMRTSVATVVSLRILQLILIIKGHKVLDCTDRLYEPGKKYVSFQELLGDHSNVLDKDWTGSGSNWWLAQYLSIKKTKATNTTITQSCKWYLFNTECHTTAFASISILVYLAWVVFFLGVARQ